MNQGARDANHDSDVRAAKKAETLIAQGNAQVVLLREIRDLLQALLYANRGGGSTGFGSRTP